jgi:hypothetical protein
MLVHPIVFLLNLVPLWVSVGLKIYENYIPIMLQKIGCLNKAEMKPLTPN